MNFLLSKGQALRELIAQMFSASSQSWSLRLRLSVFFTLFLCCIWLIVAVFSWFESRNYVNEFFDTQQTLFAKVLLASDIGSLPQYMPKTKVMLRGASEDAKGEQEDDALGFAIFDSSGRRLLDDGEMGRFFRFEDRSTGFVNTKICKKHDDEEEPWRIVWLSSKNGERIVAVGQELDYRDDMTMDMLLKHFKPWFLLLPVPLLGLFWFLHRELAPIRKTAASVEKRSPQDTTLLDVQSVPSEIKPLLVALNNLFGRMAAMLERERAFVADAAHELRTPLAGLRVQTQFLSLADTEEEREQTQNDILVSIDRCSRLVEQLLTLSRLDQLPEQGLSKDVSTIEWPELVAEAVSCMQEQAKAKDIAVSYSLTQRPEPRLGNKQLLTILLGNILGNAVKYCPKGGKISISLDKKSLTVTNDALGLEQEYIDRLGERFFRPPGQEETGCGLGVSIIKKIVKLHGLKVSFHNRYCYLSQKADGFVVSVSFE